MLISPPKWSKMGPREDWRFMCDLTPTIIKYLQHLKGDLFKARFADFRFDETVFPASGGEK